MYGDKSRAVPLVIKHFTSQKLHPFKIKIKWLQQLSIIEQTTSLLSSQWQQENKRIKTKSD